MMTNDQAKEAKDSGGVGELFPSPALARFSYLNLNVPANYRCVRCSAFGCKLWRQYQTFAEHIELLCVDDALADQGESYTVNEDGRHESDMGLCDQIKWLVPAIPDEECETYWGYTSVPDAGVLWWKHLPLRVNAPAESMAQRNNK